MQQQLAPPGRFVVLAVAMRVLADVSVEQPSFIFLHLGKTIFELNTAIFGGLHFRASESQTSFKPFEQMIIMAGMTIIAQNFDTSFRRFDTRLQRSFFLVNARKASRVKRLCGSLVGPGSG